MTKGILPEVAGGHWQSPQTRARVIARTETKYAQNISTIERGKAGGVERFVVFDGRLGPGRSLLSHIPGNVVGEHKVPGNMKPTDTLLSVTHVTDGAPPTGVNRTAEFSIHATKGGTIQNTTTNTTGGFLIVAWASAE